MHRLTLNLNMFGRTVLIVGGGQVAVRKLGVLLPTGALLKLVAPEILPDIAALQQEGRVTVRMGAYDERDLEGVFLAIAATNDRQTNQGVARAARQRGILTVISDRPDEGDVTFPAVLRRGDLEIAVSTGGRCPAFAVGVRDLIASRIGPPFGVALDRLATEREKLLTDGNGNSYNEQVLRSLARETLAGLTEPEEPLP